MADNIISQHFTKNDGSQIGNDVHLINGVYQNEKIINKNSGEKFVKSSNYRNVFDKVDEKISKIDDANANGVCSCKNSSGVEVDTFKCHVPVSNSAPTLKWGESNTIGTVDGKPLTVILPPNPNTDTNTTYSAGVGLVLNGTQFSISQEYLDKIINSVPSGPTFGESTLLYTTWGSVTQGQYIPGRSLYRNPGDTERKPTGMEGGTWRVDSVPTFHHTYTYKTGESISGQPYYEKQPVYALYASQLLD